MTLATLIRLWPLPWITWRFHLQNRNCLSFHIEKCFFWPRGFLTILIYGSLAMLWYTGSFTFWYFFMSEYFIIEDYMMFYIFDMISPLSFQIGLAALDRGPIWIERKYQEQYRKCHWMIFLSYISHFEVKYGQMYDKCTIDTVDQLFLASDMIIITI